MSRLVSLVSLVVGEGAEFLGDVTKRRKVQFTYALFERKSGPFQPVLCGSVDVTSDQNAQVIWDAVRGDIKSHTEYSANTGHHIWVYQVWGQISCFGYG